MFLQDTKAGHVPGAGLDTGAAADALLLIHLADAGGLIGVDGLLGADLAAGGIFALTAGVREVEPGVLTEKPIAGSIKIQLALDLDPADEGTGSAVIAQ